MGRFRDVKLELVRPGPPHNQLLSPLTRYLGMCGDGSPITFQIPLEHRQLLNRLERLRYIVPGVKPVPNQLREAEVLDMGEEMRKVLALIPSLNAELNRAWQCTKEGESAKDTGFVHIRLVLSGSELSLLPLELAITPQSFPGEGLRFGLQGSLPIVLTREIRRSRPLPVRWDKARPVRVLYVTAEPLGLTVPKKWHLQALRAALDPWIAWPKGNETTGEKETKRVQFPAVYADKMELERIRARYVKKRLHVLMNATIQDIYEACSTYDFTHIHILAHGDHRKEAGEDRFGIALHKRGDSSAKEVVDGERLAQALLAPGNDGVARSTPAVVTLVTCDSGNLGSVLVPGGSIAHDLHSAGIPWVFASQFPLTKVGSVRMIEFLYPRLLRGDDPRAVLYELRRFLYMNSASDHDWSSIVAYASVQDDFDRQVAGHFENQTRTALENQMEKIDNIYLSLSEKISKGKGKEDAGAREQSKENDVPTAIDSAIGTAIKFINVLIDRWERRLPNGESMDERRQRSSCYGMMGSVQKRAALWGGQQKGKVSQSKEGLKKAMNSYRKAMDEWATDGVSYHWTATQYLCLSAILKREKDKDSLILCRKFAERNLEQGERTQRAWANGTLAELELIRLWHEEDEAPTGKKKQLKTDSAEVPGSKKKSEEVLKKVEAYCREVVRLASYDSFQVESTQRQFQRYVDSWQLGKDSIPKDWITIAQAAVDVLTPPSDSA